MPWHQRQMRKAQRKSKKTRFLERELNPKHPLDVFEKKFRLPESVVIVAPGYGGHIGYDFITPDDYVIAVNRGIRTPVDHFNIWMIADKNAPNADWYADPTPEGCIHIFDDGFIRKDIDKNPDNCQYYDYVFRTGWRLEKKDWKPRYGILRGGATIGCQAIQMAFFLGAKDIRICGLRMEGRLYWDDVDSGSITERRGVWSVVPRVNRMIKWMNQNGCYISTMSDTALDVPVWAGMYETSPVA